MTSPKVRRRPAAKREPSFWWWDEKGGAVDEIIRRWQAAGPGKILKMWREADKIYFDVVLAGEAQATAKAIPAINESHVCPPICP